MNFRRRPTGYENNHKGKNFFVLKKHFLEIADKGGFRQANLEGAIFQGLPIRGVDFSGSRLQGSNFENAEIIDCNFNEIQSGLSSKDIVKLRIISLVTAFVGSLIAAYSSAFIYHLIYDAVEKNYGRVVILWTSVYAISVFFGIYILFSRGIRTYFGILLIAVVLATFLMAAIPPDDADNLSQLAENLAANSILGMACFIGVFTSIFTQSQATYLSIELEALTNQASRFWGIGFVAFLGALIGAWTSEENYFEVSFFCGMILVFCGHFLGKKARNESSKDGRFVVIRLFPDHLIKEMETRFRGATISDTNFISARIENADFSDCRIEGTLDITGSDAELLNSGNLAGSNIQLLDGAKIVKGDKIQRPPTNELIERTRLFRGLNNLPPSMFEQLVFALFSDQSDLPPQTASRTDRVTALLKLADSPSGCGLEQVREIYQEIITSEKIFAELDNRSDERGTDQEST